MKSASKSAINNQSQPAASTKIVVPVLDLKKVFTKCTSAIQGAKKLEISKTKSQLCIDDPNRVVKQPVSHITPRTLRTKFLETRFDNMGINSKSWSTIS